MDLWEFRFENSVIQLPCRVRTLSQSLLMLSHQCCFESEETLLLLLVFDETLIRHGLNYSRLHLFLPLRAKCRLNVAMNSSVLLHQRVE